MLPVLGLSRIVAHFVSMTQSKKLLAEALFPILTNSVYYR